MNKKETAAFEQLKQDLTAARKEAEEQKLISESLRLVNNAHMKTRQEVVNLLMQFPGYEEATKLIEDALPRLAK